MVFVEKTLETLLEEIGLLESEPSIIDKITPMDAEYYWLKEGYMPKYERIISQNVSNNNDAECLKKGDMFYGPRIFFLLENALLRGYKEQLGESIIVKYFFGERGVVLQVTDRGRGFDVENVIEGFKSGRPVKGQHFQYAGGGFKSLMEPGYEAIVTSSQVEPTGTTVTVMYKYKG